MNDYYKIAKISPYISTANTGDYIIAEYCDKVLKEIFGDFLGVAIPSREKISEVGASAVRSADYTFVCGTNLLSSDFRARKQWEINRITTLKIVLQSLPKRSWYKLNLIKEKLSQIHIILFGVGWVDYQSAPTTYTKRLLKSILDNNYFHSVRDSYAEEKLKSIGINNVINTACPTMWGLSEEFCRSIPTKKSEAVVTTITDYREDEERDTLLLNMLISEYKKVYLWLQSFEDIKYLKKLGYYNKVEIIPPTLESYDKFLYQHNADYIGTRLHGGIRALNHCKRSCIIGIDNRAIEIKKDTNLPVIDANSINSELISWIYGNKPTNIVLPKDNIKKWKSQFRKGKKSE